MTEHENERDDEMGWLRKNIAVLGAIGTLFAVIATQAFSWGLTSASIDELQAGQTDIQRKVDQLPPPEWRWRVESNEKKIDTLTRLFDESRADRAAIREDLREIKTILKQK